MTNCSATRRGFNRASLVSLLAAVAATSQGTAAFAQPTPSSGAPTLREVLRQKLPGEPQRDLILMEVTYPPGTGSPPHTHPPGVAAFVVSGSIASKVDDEPERTYHAGEAWYESPGAIHRVSRNASTSEPATLLAIFVAAPGASLIRPIG